MMRLFRFSSIVITAAVGLAFVAGTASCGRFWKDEAKTLAAVWLDSSEFAVPHMTFQERKSWNPFSDADLRRNFKTTIQFLKRDGEKGVPSGTKPISFDGMLISGPVRVFGGLLVVKRLPDEKAWIHELSFIRADGTARSLVKSGQRGATIRGVLLSPDQKSVLLVYNVNSEQYVLILLRHLPAEGENPPTPEVISVGGTPEIAWDAGSAFVYVKGSKSLLTWDGRRPPQPSKTGPACYFPPTRHGLAISEEGVSAVLGGGSDGTTWTFPKKDGWIPHGRIGIVPADQSGKGCPKEN